LSWIHADKGKEQIVSSFVSDATVLGLTPNVVKKCISIRRSRKIRTPDAIIAATAIAHDLVLLTSDRDFENIQGLQVIDPKLL